MGYRLLAAHWARGSATEACRAVMRYGFETLRFSEITALVVPENIASMRVLEKCGLTPTGMVEYRGLEMTRLEAFIDAAFAFCVTMMVISVDRIPDNVEELFAAFRNVPAFILSIAVLGIFWRGHWLWSRRYGLEDGVSIFISCCLILTILIYIYPLKIVFSSTWYFLSDGRVGQPIGLQTIAQARMLFALYAVGFAALALEIVLLNVRAWSCAKRCGWMRGSRP